MNDGREAPDEETGWRGSREVWMEAAKAALLEGGVDAVKIQPLAGRLSLSRTSFYWFFRDREEMLDALIERWETRIPAPSCSRRGLCRNDRRSHAQRLRLFLDDTLFDPRLEFAVRSWAHQSECGHGPRRRGR